MSRWLRHMACVSILKSVAACNPLNGLRGSPGLVVSGNFLSECLEKTSDDLPDNLRRTEIDQCEKMSSCVNLASIPTPLSAFRNFRILDRFMIPRKIDRLSMPVAAYLAHRPMAEMEALANTQGPQAVALFGTIRDIRRQCLAQHGLTAKMGDD